jgi:Domain of unknown function (DUF4157)
MKQTAATQTHQQKATAIPAVSGVLQRKCACGNHTIAGGECEECAKKQQFGLQTKLKVNEPGDIYEQEADRIADQVLASPAHSEINSSPPSIQRFSGQSYGQMDAVPASIDHALASPGRPLEAALRQDMEQRFGHDFSQVKVHSDAVAERSARDVNAQAYTVGHNIVFGAGSFVSGTSAGRRLIAHELTHVVQSGKASSQINRQTIYRQLDHAQLEARIQMLRMQLLTPVNPLRPVQEARLIQLEAMLNRTGGGGRQPAPSKPKPYLDMPFMLRFSKAWDMAKEAALQEILKNDKAYRDSSITRGLIDVKDLVPSADAVWKAGIYGRLFKNDEKGLVDKIAGKMASESYSERYKSARYGHRYGDERYYESSGKRRDDDTEIWSRGRVYGLFLPGEKARVLNISAIGIGRAAALNSLANTTDPKGPGAARLMDEIHDFTKDPAVVLLGPEIEKLFGSYGYKYRDEADRWSVADAINKAYEKSLQPNQILKDPGATVTQRWDECQRRRGAGKNNLEAAQFDPNCFQSEDEFKTEFARRENEYHKFYEDCGHSRPSHFKCMDQVAAEYRPNWAAWRDHQQRQAYDQIQKIDDVVNSGAFATGGRLVGYLAARVSGHDEQEALRWSEWGAAFGGLGDNVLAVKAGLNRNAQVKGYGGGGGLVVSRDAPVTQTVTRPSAVDPVKDDPWSGSVPRSVDVTGAKAYPPVPPPTAQQPGDPLPSVAPDLGTPTFGNIPGRVPAGGHRFELREINGRWFEIEPGTTNAKPATGEYSYVVQDGRIWASRYGHAEAAMGNRVAYAGQVNFDRGAQGVWSNASGTYKPAGAFAGQAGFRGSPQLVPPHAGKKVQLPVFQPRPGEVLDPPRGTVSRGGTTTRVPSGTGVSGTIAPPAHWLDFFPAARRIIEASRTIHGIPAHMVGMAAPGPPPAFSFASNETWIYKGLPIRAVNTPTGPRAFYRRDGSGGIRPYGAQVGDWAPFLGFNPLPGGAQLVKPPSAVSENTPRSLYRWGNQEAYDANIWLKAQPEQVPVDVGEGWGIIQRRLEELGIFVEYPIANAAEND